jgi:acetolactate synthase regulatory subunit
MPPTAVFVDVHAMQHLLGILLRVGSVKRTRGFVVCAVDWGFLGQHAGSSNEAMTAMATKAIDLAQTSPRPRPDLA